MENMNEMIGRAQQCVYTAYKLSPDFRVVRLLEARAFCAKEEYRLSTFAEDIAEAKSSAMSLGDCDCQLVAALSAAEAYASAAALVAGDYDPPVN